jgi:hypothetical protein
MMLRRKNARRLRRNRALSPSHAIKGRAAYGPVSQDTDPESDALVLSLNF